MPPSKRRQSNAMLYTVIVFIGLFIVATTVAVIYYVKAEELRTQNQELTDQRKELAVDDEYRSLGTIIGTRLPGESQIGTMVSHLDQMVRLVKGGPIPVTSAEVKVSSAVKSVQELLAQAQEFIVLPVVEPDRPDPNAVTAQAMDPNAPVTAATDPNAPAVAADPNAVEAGGVDPNMVPLTRVITALMAELRQTIENRNALQQQFAELGTKYDDAIADMQKTKDTLTAQVGEYRKEVDQIKSDYVDLRARVEQNAGELVKNMTDQRDAAREEARQFNADMLKREAELNVAQNRLSAALDKIKTVDPPPDSNAVAYKPDGKIILVNDATGVVRINLGSQDRVYRGLTFSVYDRGPGIPRNSQPKAEVEVFIVDQRVCAARIMSSNRKNPVSTDDLVANLIWDSGKENQFVIAGEFDIDKNGTTDYDAITKIGAVIRKWGGSVAEEVTAKTDYVILGTEPEVPPEPTLEELAVDPTATEKFNAARARLERYEQISQRAKSLWIPMFNYERFLHFTGYNAQANKPGAF